MYVQYTTAAAGLLLATMVGNAKIALNANPVNVSDFREVEGIRMRFSHCGRFRHEENKVASLAGV